MRSETNRALQILMGGALSLLILYSVGVASAESNGKWREYTIPESGFKVSVPAPLRNKPMTSSTPETRQTSYQAVEGSGPDTTYTVFVGTFLEGGILSQESMDAYLSSSVKTYPALLGGTKLKTERTTFRSMPASRYQFSFDNDGKPYVARGIIFMVDGGHIRLSMMHAADDPAGEENWGRFSGTFDLTPLKYMPAPNSVMIAPGVSFTPPDGWMKDSTQNPYEVARFHNLTRTINILRAGVSEYTCKNYESELRMVQGDSSKSAPTTIGGKVAQRITYVEDVPQYKVRLMIINYCFESRSGAIVLGGAEDEAMFSRWEPVFEGAAASLRIQ